ncbi:sporulation protein [Paenibacillus qinlingensis]|uniref:Sporulation-control protein n=1 Tax=Paenibacillus qinlingensis TaxID=1837343 RepID=A0ABU1NWE4_9BACL|nr:sporulation protein [Paenibacillus qinlingensis]MDR6551785.1 sporulation-control protein [Paenibacillus qinlingensis]
MSFFKNMMAKIGIGNIDFDTKFYTESFIPGELVEGVIVAKGGSVEQKVDKIYFQIMTQYRKPSPSESNPNFTVIESVVIANILLGESLVFAPGESIEIPFHFVLPHETPISIGVSPIWIRTGMDIDNAVDPSDRDDIQVLAHPHTSAIFEALEELGFHLHKAENEYFPQRNSHLPFIQNFEFVPYKNSEFSRSVEEVELVFSPDENGVKILLEFDRKARGFSGLLAEMLDMDESHHRYYFSADELNEGTAAVAAQFRGIFNHLLG